MKSNDESLLEHLRCMVGVSEVIHEDQFKDLGVFELRVLPHTNIHTETLNQPEAEAFALDIAGRVYGAFSNHRIQCVHSASPDNESHWCEVRVKDGPLWRTLPYTVFYECR